jgi:predicted Fe-Mo cluster-binding NifX family protein
MKRIRIAFPSNDGEETSRGHMGMAKYFYIYDLFEKGESSFVERRENTSPPELTEHGDPVKMKAVLEICSGCDVIAGTKLSPNFRSVSNTTEFQPLVVGQGKLTEIVSELLANYEQIYDLIQRRKEGQRTRDVPKLLNEQGRDKGIIP